LTLEGRESTEGLGGADLQKKRVYGALQAYKGLDKKEP